MSKQMHIEANFTNEFWPSSTYREKFRSTRKMPREFSVGFRMPGYYQTAGYSKDKNWFILAVFIEVLAFYLTVNGGISRGTEWTYLAILTAVFFVVLDIAGASLLHSKVADKIHYINMAVITKDPIGAQGYLKKATTIGGRQIAGVTLILLSAFLKYFALFLLGSFRIVILGIIVILYVIVVYIHCYHTGYYLAENSRQRILHKEMDEFREESMKISNGENIKSHYQAFPIMGAVSEPSLLKLNTNNSGIIHINGHQIIEDTTTDGQYTYKIKTKGLLTDDQIVAFTQNQNENQIKFILNLCLTHQITALK
jgi:hypothetical protein